VLGQLAQTLRSLYWLDIKVGKFDDDTHLATLVDAMSENSTMETLPFSFIFSGQGASLSKAMQELFASLLETSNFSLTTLCFGTPCIDPVVDQKIKWFSKLNRVVGRKELLRDANATKETWIEALEAANRDVPCLFHILSSNPMLCSIDAVVGRIGESAQNDGLRGASMPVGSTLRRKSA
jgi:hypothetical protein